MIISTSSSDIHLTPDIDTLVHDRMQASLSAFAGRVDSLDVRLCEVKRPKGSADCAATVQIHLRGGRKVVAEGVDKYVSAAVRRAAHHARRAVRRQLGRAPARRTLSVREVFDGGRLVVARGS